MNNKQLFKHPNRICLHRTNSGYRLDWWFYGTVFDLPENREATDKLAEMIRARVQLFVDTCKANGYMNKGARVSGVMAGSIWGINDYDVVDELYEWLDDNFGRYVAIGEMPPT